MSRIAALRVFLAVAALSTFAACASPTEPTTRKLTVRSATSDLVPSSTCRSGWATSEGRCVDDTFGLK